jgi:1,4-alpha-glucan branching enzyme
VATVGFNGFQNAIDVVLSGSPPAWGGTFNVHAQATSIDIVLKNAAGTIYDNNGGSGVDWQFLTSEATTERHGAQPIDPAFGGGFLFQVWAPDVSSVAVVGDFNSYNSQADLMVFDPARGVWGAHVPGANAGQEYKFLLDGSEYRRDPRGRQVRGAFDNSVLVDPSTFTFAQPRPGSGAGFRDWVLYELHIGTLDPAGGIAPGSFSDLIPGRLDYLAALNINAIHVMPVNEFPGTTSGGYNLTEPFAIERDYGTPDEFRTFVEECHARGIAVIVDIVHNHYGPGGLDLYDFQDLNGNALRDEPGIYFYDSPVELAESGFGPRPDYGEPEVREFIQQAVETLLDEYNVDGFRWDFTKAIRGTVDGSFNVTGDLADGISLLQELNANLLAPNADLVSIAEDLAGDARLVAPVASISGDPNDGFGFDAQWDAAFHYQLVPQLQQTLDSAIDLGQISAAVGGDFSRVHYLESHDLVWEINGGDRVPPRIDPADPESLRARKMSALGAGLLLTTEGIPMMFQGSELLDVGGGDGDDSWDDDDPIDWTRLSDPDIAGFQTIYRDLIALRRNLDGVSAGLLGDQTTIFLADTTNKVIAYARSNGGATPGDVVVVVANFSSTDFSGGYDVGLPEAGSWYELLNSDDTAYGTDFGDVGVGQAPATVAVPLHGYAQRATVQLAARSVVILGQADPVPVELSAFEVE